ncbi:MAG: DUF1778 domain-containing protein [Polaromonas sp.]|nr:MAG: DUF1778 domain-containing protein [Polaromonas sp.]
MTGATQNPDSKSAQISLRIPFGLRPLIAQAAAIQKISVNRFIEAHCSEAARQTVEKHALKQSDSRPP